MDVRESAPITTPPSYTAAMMVVCDAPGHTNRQSCEGVLHRLWALARSSRNPNAPHRTSMRSAHALWL